VSNSTPEEQARLVKEALFAGRKIEAIRLYRLQTGIGLKEAKDAVETLEKELRTSSPELFSKSAAGGCFGAILLIPLLAAAIYALIC
jgi:ribosomal protein L7/L12